jgi:DNA-binding transcriptional ArsR family regulator
MSTGPLDPLIHNPQRLRIVATLAALPDGDTLSVSRLHAMTGLPPGSPVIGLRELARAGYVRYVRYVRTGVTGADKAQTTVALTGRGRAALDRYTAVLAQLPQAVRQQDQPPAPGMRAGDADRDAAAAALGEHFAHGRLTLDELCARLDAALTASTHGELAQAARDLPELTVFPARAGLPRGKRARPQRKPGRAPGVRA